ncbi:MAG TPA: GntR family transcriptional regulator [Herbaspirillum sp.]
MDLTITPRTVQLETVKKLREAIISGYFKAGARLVETDLCKQLGVSRTSVREAIRVLSSEKLLILVPNKGPSVADISAEEAMQIYHVRKMLEGEAAALAAKNGTDDDIAEMQRALENFEQAVKDDDAALRISATSEFYEAIIRRSGNQVIGDLIHGLLARVNLLRVRTMSIPGRAKRSASELRKIYEAIAAHDVRGARAAAVEHVAAAYKEVKENLELPR